MTILQILEWTFNSLVMPLSYSKVNANGLLKIPDRKPGRTMCIVSGVSAGPMLLNLAGMGTKDPALTISHH